MSVRIEVSWGELLDKMSILRIKSERIGDPQKLENVRRELALLERASDEAMPEGADPSALVGDLREVNERLWVIEDDIRDHEARKDFGSSFVELARAVYKTNDRRSELKRRLNEELGSRLVEEKSHVRYD